MGPVHPPILTPGGGEGVPWQVPPATGLFPGWVDGDAGPLPWCPCRQCKAVGMLWDELRGAGDPLPVQGGVCTPQAPTQPGLLLQQPLSGQPESHTETKWIEPFD